ncbi:aldo/keto reductase [Streptomyces laculatispora]|uniref:aldo/keto reductase n=1 Tax=Streptomyces laculatispora TaxID=887464 RepID=UPI001A9429C9|nr:aldo/keto reductase [Streptomyces laculatispora]MBO0917445.1 aldo/keto reductase [Streptomyces laculatispora]
MKYRTIGTDPATRREVSVLALGAMLFGSVTDERTSFAVLDHYVEAGGTFIDTSDNYAFWVDGGVGGQSERLLGKWRRSRGVGDEIVIATKLGAAPLAPGTGYTDNPEGRSAKAVREAAERSRERLTVLREIAAETGASVNQVVLAWQIGVRLPVIPLAGASSVAQLKENLAAVDLELTDEQRARLDGAH